MSPAHQAAILECIGNSNASECLKSSLGRSFLLCEGVFSELDIEMSETADKLRKKYGKRFPVKHLLRMLYPDLPDDYISSLVKEA